MSTESDLALADALDADAGALEQQAAVQARYRNHAKWNDALLASAKAKRTAAAKLRDGAGA